MSSILDYSRLFITILILNLKHVFSLFFATKQEPALPQRPFAIFTVSSTPFSTIYTFGQRHSLYTIGKINKKKPISIKKIIKTKNKKNKHFISSNLKI